MSYPPTPGIETDFSTIQHHFRGLIERLDYRRFVEQWTFCHIADAALCGMPFTPNHIELPLPAMRSSQIAHELDATEASRSLPNMPTVLEPRNSDAAS